MAAARQRGSSDGHRSECDHAVDGRFPGAFLNSRDWSRSPLGPVAAWPHALRAAASLMHDSMVPMWLAWGESLTMVYNEAYAAMLGAKHPDALGAPLAQVWAEVWPDARRASSGYTRNAIVHNGMLDAGVHLLGKPFSPDELAARVRQVLDETA